MSGYGVLAPFYDRFFEAGFDRRVVHKYLRLLAPYGFAGRRVLDLGCGTGRISLPLARRGCVVTGVDPDAGMLAAAQVRAAGEPMGTAVEWGCATIHAIASERRFDYVVSALDVLNHIIDEEELYGTLKAVYARLEPGGALIFDVNTRKKFEQLYARHVYTYRSGGAVCVWKNHYDSATGLCRFDIRLAGSGGRRETGVIFERFYPDELLLAMLRECGFGPVSLYGMDRGTRRVYCCRKRR